LDFLFDGVDGSESIFVFSIDIGFADLQAFVDFDEIRLRRIRHIQCLVDVQGIDGDDSLVVDTLIVTLFKIILTDIATKLERTGIL